LTIAQRHRATRISGHDPGTLSSEHEKWSGEVIMTGFSWPTVATEDAVARAGWSPRREIDIEEWVAQLTLQGYFFSDLAKAIHKSFGGLAIRPLMGTPEATWASDPIFFDPMDAGDGMDERYKPLEARLGHRMSPLASWGAENTAMSLDDGRIVSDSSFGLQLLGDTFPGAFDLLLRRYRKPISQARIPDQLQGVFLTMSSTSQNLQA
jgi:hypothetical protein